MAIWAVPGTQRRREEEETHGETPRSAEVGTKTIYLLECGTRARANPSA